MFSGGLSCTAVIIRGTVSAFLHAFKSCLRCLDLFCPFLISAALPPHLLLLNFALVPAGCLCSPRLAPFPSIARAPP